MVEYNFINQIFMTHVFAIQENILWNYQKKNLLMLTSKQASKQRTTNTLHSYVIGNIGTPDGS